MKLSIVLLSRQRRELLANLLDSIAKQTVQPELLDVIVGMDVDDVESIRNSTSIENRHKFCTAMFRTRQFNMHEYINFMARASEGEYVMVLNDDCEINTYGWDDAIRSEIKDQLTKWPDGIFYIRTKDNSIDKVGGAEYASFPIVSRKAIDAAGIFMDPNFPCHGADVATWRIYDAIGRVHPTECFEINHILHATTEMIRRKDETALNMIARTITNTQDYWSSDISPYVDKLKAAIECESV